MTDILPNILIVEDDHTYGIIIKKWIDKNGYTSILSSQIKDAKKILLENKIDLIISDLRLPDGDGIQLLSWINVKKINVPLIIMTSYAEVQNAVLSMKLGAFDYLEKPIRPPELKTKINEALNFKSQAIGMPVKERRPISEDVVLGISKLAKEMYKNLEIVSPTNLSVLIIGESGTGKERLAEMIHKRSSRRDAPFIAVDCGSLSKELAPSELFGHIKGSFTSALADKTGVFEIANGGTVFLDEIGNLDYEIQKQLLRTLQEKKIRKVGANLDIKVDIRIISATNENLELAINNGKFREDLFHRINEFTLNVPALRERQEDIPLFIDYFIQKSNIELNKEVKSISKDCVEILKDYYWSGNIREMQNLVRRMVLFSEDNNITIESLPDTITNRQNNIDVSLHGDNEKEKIIKALRMTAGNKSKAAKLLGVDRKTLYNKMHLYNLDL